MDNDLERLWILAPLVGTEGVRDLCREVQTLRNACSYLPSRFRVPITDRITFDAPRSGDGRGFQSGGAGFESLAGRSAEIVSRWIANARLAPPDT